jgi:hypothetical protein
MALHHENLFLSVMCHSGDVSKQDDGGAARIGPSFPFRVKLRNTQHEQMSSALLPGTDIWHAQSLRRSRPLCGQRRWKLARSDLWLNLQKRYDLHQAQQELGEKIKKIPGLEVA